MSMDPVAIRPMRPGDADAVAALAEHLIGPGYYPPETVLEYLARSTVGDVVCSHVAHVGERLVGFRFALPPGRWEEGRGLGLHPERWPAPLERCAYFQSSYVDDAFAGRRIGRRMALEAIAALKRLGAAAIVTHSWKESPHGSSLRYLTRLGFVAVAELPAYWSEVDYVCRLDGKPCLCTAIEMVLDLTRPQGAAEHSPKEHT